MSNSNFNINKFCNIIQTKQNGKIVYKRPESCSISNYSKLKTYGNDPSISGRMRYAEYIRNTKPSVNRSIFVEPEIIIEDVVLPDKWRRDFFIDSSGNAFISYLVESIPDYQFFNNSNLLYVYFEDRGLLTSGIAAFSGSNLISIDFPNSLNFLGNNSFENCLSLNDVNLSLSLNLIDQYTFSGCTNLNTVTNLFNIKTIDSFAFFNCSNIISLQNLDSLETIGNNAFENCTSLTSLDTSNKLINFGIDCFKNCNSLNRFDFSNNINTIPNGVFLNCQNLSIVELGDNLQEIGDSVFKNCPNLKQIDLPNTVTSIGSNVFESSGIEDITLSENLLSISQNCFKNCDKITTINITNSTRTLEDSCFLNCINLQTVNINSNSSLTSIKDNAFRNCNLLSTIQIPDNLIDIGSSCFFDCKNIIDINLPDSVIELGSSIFSGCFSLRNVTFGTGIINLPEFTCNKCTQLSNIVINGNITSIDQFSFSNCIFIKNINLPISLTSISNNVFEECISLDNVNISNVNVISDRSFFNCKNLVSINISPNLNYIGEFAFFNSKFNHFYFPSTLKRITNNAFNKCNLLKTIEFHQDSVEVIEDEAFRNCVRLNHIFFPNSIKQIGNNVFKNNTKLDQVYLTEASANALNKTNGFQEFFGINTNINILSTLNLPLLIEFENIPNTNLIRNKIFLIFNTFTPFLLTNKITINNIRGNIISSGENASFFSVGSNTPIFVPKNPSDYNNIDNLHWLYPNFSLAANTKCLIASIIATNQTIANINYQYGDNSRDNYSAYNLKMVYGKIYKLKDLSTTIPDIIYDEVKLPLFIQYTNVTIDGSKYVINDIYLRFSNTDVLYSNKISTNIEGQVFINDQNLENTNLEIYNSKFMINDEIPFLLPSKYNSWNNLNNQIWFLPNKTIIPEINIQILRLTLSKGSQGNFTYTYADPSKNNYFNSNLRILDGYIGVV